MSLETRRQHWISENWNYRQLWAAMCVLGTKPWSFVIVTSAFNCWTISSVPTIRIFKMMLYFHCVISLFAGMGDVHTCVQVKEHIQESVLSLYNVGLENWIWGSLLGHKQLYPENHVADSMNIHFVINNTIVKCNSLPLRPLNKAFFL